MIPHIEGRLPRRRGARRAQALMRRLLLDALRALGGPPPTARAARVWIAARDPAEPLSFQNVCDALGLEPNALRAALLS